MNQCKSLRLEISQVRCTSCGLCLEECPSGAMQQDSETEGLRIEEGRCIRCSHCGIVCPVDAISTNKGPFPSWRDPKLAKDRLKALLVGKRSVRQYRSDRVPREVWEEILHVGTLTSTASNAQNWHATILRLESVKEVGARIMDYYRTLVRRALNPLMRPVLFLTAARSYLPSLKRYRRYIEEYFGLKKQAVSAAALPTAGRDRQAIPMAGRDRCRDRRFFHAPGVIILSAPKKDHHLGLTNCVLAGQAMMYYAQSLGLGSCMIGYAEIALNRMKSLRRDLEIPPSNKIGLVFTLGYPAVRYRALPLRGPMPVRYHGDLKS